MIELEGAEAARATATGMAAVTTAILAPLKAGDHVVAAKAMFGSCRYVVEDLLPRYGIQSTLVDGLDLDQWRKAMRPNTKTLLPGEPDQPDARRHRHPAEVAEIAHKAGARLIVDNVFATPILQKPLSTSAPISSSTPPPSISTARAAASAASCSPTRSLRRRSPAHLHAPDRPVDVAVQCLGAAEGPGDAGGARARADRDRGADRRCARAAIRRSRG